MPDHQLELIHVPAAPLALTSRQQAALHVVQQAGIDGATAEEVGAALCAMSGKHDIGARCPFDSQNGNGMLRALRKKGLVKYRIRVGWVTVGDSTQAIAAPSGMLASDEPLPY